MIENVRVQAEPATAIQLHAHKSVENNCGGKCIGLVGVTTSLACSFPGGKVRMGAFFIIITSSFFLL